MIIEFTVRNFRSLRDEQSLTFVPTALTELAKTNTLSSEVDGVNRLLASAVIYGANAAGKTSVLDALTTMRSIVLRSGSEEAADAKLPVKPFLFDDSANKPTLFEVVFVHGGVRYQYGFEATDERILEEWLYAYPDRRSQKVFTRAFNLEDGKYSWNFGHFLKGQKATWRDATRPNALFVSTASLLNSEQMLLVQEWFRNYIIIGAKKQMNETARIIEQSNVKDIALKILHNADVGIVDLKLTEKSLDAENPLVQAIKTVLPEAQAKAFVESKTYEVSTLHRTPDGAEVWLDMEQESEGTRILFAQIGPIIKALSRGAVLVFDELNNSLHPLLARAVVELFHNPTWNNKGSQLIFTTHATSLLSTEILRRDQIWFAEKSTVGDTKIYPLTDFEPRKEASLAKNYLQGRYGAIPFISADPWESIQPSVGDDYDG